MGGRHYLHSDLDSPSTEYAIDAIRRLEFFNGFFAVLIEVFVAFSSTANYRGVTITAVILVVAFLPMMFWVLSKKPPRLAAGVSKRLKVENRTIVTIFLIFVHVVLIGAITWAELAPHEQSKAAATSTQHAHEQVAVDGIHLPD